MRIGISTDGELVAPHFGRCPVFTIADIEGDTVSREVVQNPGHQPGLVPQFLHERGVECVVCSGMGMRARALFDELGIRAIMGVTGTVDEVIEKLKNGTLEGGESLCSPGAGKGYGLDKSECDHATQHEPGVSDERRGTP